MSHVPVRGDHAPRAEARPARARRHLARDGRGPLQALRGVREQAERDPRQARGVDLVAANQVYSELARAQGRALLRDRRRSRTTRSTSSTSAATAATRTGRRAADRARLRLGRRLARRPQGDGHGRARAGPGRRTTGTRGGSSTTSATRRTPSPSGTRRRSSRSTSTSTRTSSTTRPTARRTSTRSSTTSTGRRERLGVEVPDPVAIGIVAAAGGADVAAGPVLGTVPRRRPAATRPGDCPPCAARNAGPCLSAVVLAGYLLGSIPFGYWLVRALRAATTSAGTGAATSARRTSGAVRPPRTACPSSLLDIAKGFVPGRSSACSSRGDLAGSPRRRCGDGRPLAAAVPRLPEGREDGGDGGRRLLGVAPLVALVGAWSGSLLFLRCRYASVASMGAAAALPRRRVRARRAVAGDRLRGRSPPRRARAAPRQHPAAAGGDGEPVPLPADCAGLTRIALPGRSSACSRARGRRPHAAAPCVRLAVARVRQPVGQPRGRCGGRPASSARSSPTVPAALGDDVVRVDRLEVHAAARARSRRRRARMRLEHVACSAWRTESSTKRGRRCACSTTKSSSGRLSSS